MPGNVCVSKSNPLMDPHVVLQTSDQAAVNLPKTVARAVLAYVLEHEDDAVTVYGMQVVRHGGKLYMHHDGTTYQYSKADTAATLAEYIGAALQYQHGVLRAVNAAGQELWVTLAGLVPAVVRRRASDDLAAAFDGLRIAA